MKKPLRLPEIKDLTRDAVNAFKHPECATCECYLGYLVQLALDAEPDAQAYLNTVQPPRDEIHSCLGCDPCPPGILYGE